MMRGFTQSFRFSENFASQDAKQTEFLQRSTSSYVRSEVNTVNDWVSIRKRLSHRSRFAALVNLRRHPKHWYPSSPQLIKMIQLLFSPPENSNCLHKGTSAVAEYGFQKSAQTAGLIYK
eukprot:IDg3566t1